MKDSPIRKFCESPQRWLIVTTVSLFVALALLLPLTDDLYGNLQRCDALSEELGRSKESAVSVAVLEAEVGQLTEQLGALEARTVDEVTIGEYRSRIVELVRASDCQIRRIDISAPVVREWREGDEAVRAEGAPADQEKKATPFSLERRSLVLAVDGSMQALFDLLQKIDEDANLAYSHGLRLQPGNRQGKVVTLELELWLFNLTRGKAA